MSSLAANLISPLCEWLTAHGTSCLELFGFVTGVVNVWLVAREHIWSWPLGIANAMVYFVVFAQAGLYSDTGLQAVYFLLSWYGWWQWARRSGSSESLAVTDTPRRHALSLLATTIGLWLLLALVTRRIPGVALPWLDAALVSVSVVAQFMMTRKWREHWLLWIAVDVVYIIVFINRHLPLTALLYAVFLALAIFGYRQWKHRRIAQPSTASSASS